ncbi:MAG: hypothetical protein PVH88_24465 [Ignavibacteria bacterium]|jgi:hypothetical protein
MFLYGVNSHKKKLWRVFSWLSRIIATPQYNGNISWMMWNNSSLTDPHGLVGYTFDYDDADRLKKADYGYYSSGWQTTSKNDVTNLQYDDNGNITSLKRYDIDGNLMDDFTYHYTMSSYGNRLLYVDDNASSSIADDDIDDQETGNYTYDGNGNMTGDAGKNISSIEYDIKNLPYQMDFGLLSLLTLSTIEIDNEITYKAKDTIRTQNTVIILSGGDVRFTSGNTIICPSNGSMDIQKV